jgi:hypothetical protein
MLQFGLRLGEHPRQVITTTPRPTLLLKRLLVDPRSAVTRSKTIDNSAHLAPDFFRSVVARYAGTRLGRQELDGEMIEDRTDALFTRAMIETQRCDTAPPLLADLDGLAVRVPLLNASLTDAVFQVQREVTVDEVNDLLRTASEGDLAGILGFEHRPLVSADYTNDTRSGIVDGLSTMVVDGRMVKVLVWYDNEYGYVFRWAELAAKVAAGLASVS